MGCDQLAELVKTTSCQSTRQLRAEAADDYTPTEASTTAS